MFAKKVITALIIASIFMLSVIVINKKLLPAALKISYMRAENTANEIIDLSVQSIISETKVKSSDFIEISGSDFISADTVLINRLCALTSQSITSRIKEAEREKILIPIGLLSGVDIFANTGPNITFRIMKQGNASVDYETSFASSGINQTNFKIWIKVSLNIKIVNPLAAETVTVSRKIMLIDGIIKGAVPEGYINVGD